MARSLNNLGHLLHAQGKYGKAEPLYREALAMGRPLFSKERFPHGHPELALSLNNLAAVLRAKGTTPGAEPFLSEALAMYRAHLLAVAEGVSEAAGPQLCRHLSPDVRRLPLRHTPIDRRPPAVYEELWQRRRC